MIQSTKVGSLTKLTATTGLIHKVGTETYAKSIIMLPSDTLDMYEDVAEKPAYTKAEYDAKVAELVREKYTESEEFAIQRKALNLAFAPSAMSMATLTDASSDSTSHSSPSETSSSTDAILKEYHAYNSYVEDCKYRAHSILSNPQPVVTSDNSLADL